MPIRTETRIRALALQLLYAWDQVGEDHPDIRPLWTAICATRGSPPHTEDRALDLAEAVVRDRGRLDGVLRHAAANWRLERLAVVDRNVLRLALAEMERGDTPVKVVIDEAIRLARWFGAARSPAFVNGILDRVARERGWLSVLLVNWQDRTNPQAGGAEVHLHEIFGRLASGGHEVHLLCSGYAGATPDAALDGIAVHRVGSRYRFALAARGAFRSLAARLRPDVVVEDVNKVPLFLPGLWGGPFVVLVPHLFGTTAFREVPWPMAAAVWSSERPMPRAYRGVLVHAISESTRDDLVARGFRRDAIRVIYPGVDTQRYRPEPGVAKADRPTFLYVGRLKRYKALEVAIHAVVELRRSAAPEARLLIAGGGDDRPRLERIVAECGAAAAVSFLGFVAEERKLELYRQAWAVVFPSPKEGWGITNVEAAACGTPAVASDSPGLRESVRAGETGLLVPHGDVGALADGLRALASDRAVRERLGRGARAFAESIPWSRAARETVLHLEEAVAARRRPEDG